MCTVSEYRDMSDGDRVGGMKPIAGQISRDIHIKYCTLQGYNSLEFLVLFDLHNLR